MNAQIIIAAVIAACGFGTAWKIQSYRIDSLELEYAKQRMAAERLSAKETIRLTKEVTDAKNAAQLRAVSLRRDADGTRTALVSLSDATDAALRDAHTSNAACIERADSLGKLLVTVAQTGGDMAAKADAHASDARTLIDAWPK